VVVRINQTHSARSIESNFSENSQLKIAAAVLNLNDHLEFPPLETAVLEKSKNQHAVQLAVSTQQRQVEANLKNMMMWK
jgi:hypothetical protein